MLWFALDSSLYTPNFCQINAYFGLVFFLFFHVLLAFITLLTLNLKEKVENCELFGQNVGSGGNWPKCLIYVGALSISHSAFHMQGGKKKKKKNIDFKVSRVSIYHRRIKLHKCLSLNTEGWFSSSNFMQ